MIPGWPLIWRAHEHKAVSYHPPDRQTDRTDLARHAPRRPYPSLHTNDDVIQMITGHRRITNEQGIRISGGQVINRSCDHQSVSSALRSFQ